MQLGGFNRFLQDGCVGKFRNNGVRPVTCDEGEWYFSVGEDIGDGVGLFAAEVHVENARLKVVAFGGEDGVVEPVIGAVNLVTEGGQHVCQHH